ncbi:MAG TPA: ABC transporter permease [Pirellulales bacterium]|jgi:ABC-type Na+ efflux pump permease subunit|nr:ABC transporter permease [Pirellulales bacterium]
MAIWTLARKDFRVVWRDRRALIVLMGMPLLLILVLGLSLGEGFGQKPDDRLRISIVDLDRGSVEHDAQSKTDIPHHWAQEFQDDLAGTAGIRVERIATLDEAKQLVEHGRRAAVWVFGPDFSQRLTNCSFLVGGVNPLDRDGVDLATLDSQLLRDPTQLTASSIIAQVAQGTTLRIVLPWMIGRAFNEVGKQMGGLVQTALARLFPNYNLTATTWAGLTRSKPRASGSAAITTYQTPEENGLLNRGAARYQILVPTYLVTFAYFLVLVVGRLFVSERQQGTMTRLRAAPLSRFQIMAGKFLPTYFLSVLQGVFLLVAGKLAFAMSWGDQPLWLVPVVLTTSLSAMGLALVVAALSRTESQVAIYGTLVVLALAGASGSLLGDRELMPAAMQRISLFTPQAWALDAYRQLLANPAGPNLWIVGECCGVLTLFGAGLIVIGWKILRLDAAA